jgi:hypothetical protein
MKSKTEPWPKHGLLSIPVRPETEVFTCELDQLRRPSAIPTGKKGQKCIVVMLDDSENVR